MTESIKNLKDLINKNYDKLLKNYPKKDSKEYLFISQELKDLFYFLFDLEELKLECMLPTCKFDFFILSQSDSEKIYNKTHVAGDYDKIYFYPWLIEQFPEEQELIQKAFVDFKKYKNQDKN